MSRFVLRIAFAALTLLPFSVAIASVSGSSDAGSTVTKEITARDLGAHAGLVQTLTMMRRVARGSVADRDLKFELVRSVHRGVSGELVGYRLKVSTPRTIHLLDLDRDGRPTSDWTIERFASEIKGDQK